MDSRIFWANVKNLRHRSGIAVEQMAEGLGMSQYKYSDIENNSTKDVSQEIQEKCAAILGRTIKELWDYMLQPMPFWDNEKKYRIAKDISGEKIAKALGLKGRQGFHLKEARKNPIKISEAKVIASVLGTTVEVLMDAKKTSEKINNINNVIQSNNSEISSLFELRDRLPDEVYRWLFEKDTVNKIIKMYEISRG